MLDPDISFSYEQLLENLNCEYTQSLYIIYTQINGIAKIIYNAYISNSTNETKSHKISAPQNVSDLRKFVLDHQLCTP